MFSLSLGLLILLLGFISSSTQSPFTDTYSRNLLLLAKASEALSFQQAGEFQCENFYTKVCGNWKTLQPATWAHPKTSYLDQISELYVEKCKQLLENYDGKNAYCKMLENFYHSCTNTKRMQELSMQPVIGYLNFQGGWPKNVFPRWYEDEYDWLKTIADIRRDLGIDIFIGLQVIQSLESRYTYHIQIGAPQLPLGTKSKYLSTEYETERLKYKENIKQKLSKEFTDMPEIWASEVAQQVLDVEQNLAKGLHDNETITLRDAYRDLDMSQRKQLYSKFVDLNQYLDMVFNKTIHGSVHEFPASIYFTNLLEVIEKTPKITLANYTMWRVLEKLNFFDYNELNKVEHKNWCTEQTMKYFPDHVEYLYSEHFNIQNTRTEIYEFFQNLTGYFRNRLENITQINWMSSRTRRGALKKLQSLKLQIDNHYPATLEQEVQNIVNEIKGNTYYENMLKILKWKSNESLKKLDQEFRLMKKKTDAILPYYDFQTNKINIPVRFIQSHFLWDPAYPKFIKYGTLGVLLAQQMLYGFFDEGRLYNEVGDYQNWWDKDTDATFQTHTDCFSKQYKNYKFQGKSVDDEKAVVKAITDAGAISLTYEAYTDWLSHISEDELKKENLPHLNYGPKSGFFVFFGQMYCADYYQFSSNKLNTLPERLRVNGALANFDEFAKEFKCAQDSKMSPRNKCGAF